MNEFELGKPGWFEVQNVEANDFLNQKLTTDQYGIWYSIKFTGDASTHLWQTKTAPVEGEKYWGTIELTKSGKTTKFHWDKQNTPPENRPEKAHDTSFKADPVKQDNIHRSVALEQAINFGATAKLDVEATLNVATRFYEWLTNKTASIDSENASGEQSTTAVHDFSGDNAAKPDKIIADDGEEPINLEELPW